VLQGHHVARLAADLRDLLTQLDLREVTVLGTSMGAAVIWSYLELFGEERLKQVGASGRHMCLHRATNNA
jgi:pimeloyl-ACP methyl ester carboxylesterase